MDFHELDEHAMLRQSVRATLREYGSDYYVDRARNHEPTTEAWEALSRGGFTSVNVPEEYGGGGQGLSELAIVCEEAAAAGCPQLFLLVSSGIAAEILKSFGSEQQKQEWLPRIVEGKKIAFAITEPEAGSNSHRISTRVRREDDEWAINGQKYYISGLDEADAVLVVANEEGEKGRLSLFLVPTGTPGLLSTPISVDVPVPEKQFTVFFDGVRVDDEALIGEAGNGFKQVFRGLNPERILGAALCVGVARHVLGRASEYANQRSVFDRPIGAYQSLAHPLAEAYIQTEMAALMMRKAAWLHDTDQSAGESSNVAKLAAADAALAAADHCIQTHGGNGVSAEFGFLPYWGIARLLKFAPVSREMVLNYISQHSLGLPRSY